MFGCPVETIKSAFYPSNVVSTCLVLHRQSTAVVRFLLQNRFLEKLLFLAFRNRVSLPWKYMVPICLFCPWFSSFHCTYFFIFHKSFNLPAKLVAPSHCQWLSAWFFGCCEVFFYVAESDLNSQRTRLKKTLLGEEIVVFGLLFSCSMKPSKSIFYRPNSF